MCRIARVSVGMLLWVLLPVSPIWVSPASANLPVDACCFDNVPCQNLDALSCEAEGGDSIPGVDCEEINCGARHTVPVMSILGGVGLAGALAGLAIHRLTLKRRR
jgi:hypothetical protein